MPAKWLIKSEPCCYSFADLRRDKQTVWDGVSNSLALRNLRAMRRGDLALVYHTGKEKSVVGLAEITSDPYADPKLNDPRFIVVDIKARHPLPRRVTLQEVKQEPRLSNLDLVRLPRLSVSPVSDPHWAILMKLAGEPSE